MRAIQHANRILDWQINLTEEEMPPDWMWIFEDELSIWLDRVIKERGSSASGDVPAEGYVENELAKDRR